MVEQRGARDERELLRFNRLLHGEGRPDEELLLHHRHVLVRTHLEPQHPVVPLEVYRLRVGHLPLVRLVPVRTHHHTDRRERGVLQDPLRYAGAHLLDRSVGSLVRNVVKHEQREGRIRNFVNGKNILRKEVDSYRR